MSRAKKHRHRKDHDKRSAEDRPASTDVADLSDDADADADHKASASQLNNDHDYEETRFGEGKVSYDAQGRILSISVVGDMTRVMIGLGKDQGIHVGMEGYIKSEGGMFADFQIEEVRERTSFAKVDATPDAIQQNGTNVVVNPTSMPKSSAPRHDIKTRIIGVSIEGGKTRIKIGVGTRHGARWGMKGYVVGGGGGQFMRFTVDEEHPGYVEAFVDTTIDGLGGHHDIVLNPS